MDTGAHGHEPVLLDEVIRLLAPQSGQTLLDCTIGRGSHAAAIARFLGPRGLVLGVDVDPENLAYVQKRFIDIPVECRLFHGNFCELPEVLAAASREGVDMILADLGVSTNQMLSVRYGLSFSMDGPLDMRLDPRIKRTAADLVATLTERQLADLIFHNAQERQARRIARFIVQARRATPIATTRQLAQIVRRAAGPVRHGRIDAATRTFQALRMAVNQELENLQMLLEAIPRLLNPGGVAVVISFHSGEDRLVKQAMRRWHDQNRGDILTAHPVTPARQEMQRNPRSRSAKLRAVRFAGPANVPVGDPPAPACPGGFPARHAS
jgi:16S rRNA (cytosine1402-N4)-methyltransferase